MNPNTILHYLGEQLTVLYDLKNLDKSIISGVSDELSSLTDLICVILIRDVTSAEKMSMIMSENISERISEIFRQLPKEPAVTRLLNQSKQNNLDIGSYLCSICDECGGELVAESSHKVCKECGGIVLSMYDIIRNSRTRNENTMQHLSSWIDRIQGLESTKIKDKIINELRSKIIDDNRLRNGKMRDISSLSTDDIKEYLSQLGYSSYYRNVVKIRNIIFQHFGITPESALLTQNEREKIISLFNKCFSSFEIIKNDPSLLDRIEKEKVSNLPFYPYILCKILPYVIKDYRLPIFIRSIIPQEYDTICKNDILWKYICMNVDEIDYNITNVAEYIR